MAEFYDGGATKHWRLCRRAHDCRWPELSAVRAAKRASERASEKKRARVWLSLSSGKMFPSRNLLNGRSRAQEKERESSQHAWWKLISICANKFPQLSGAPDSAWRPADTVHLSATRALNKRAERKNNKQVACARRQQQKEAATRRKCRRPRPIDCTSVLLPRPAVRVAGVRAEWELDTLAALIDFFVCPPGRASLAHLLV